MIDTQAIRNRVLNLALQGKLTIQSPEDGDAETLYQQIQTQKQIIEQIGKKKKAKSPIMVSKDKMPFFIPETWKWVSVDDVCTNIQYGSSQKSSASGKVAVIRMGNLQSGKIVYDKLVYTSDESEIAKYPLEKNDLLFNRTNSMELVGKTAIYKGEMQAIYAGYLVRITPIIMIPDYLNYIMQTQYYWGYCRTVRIDANGQSNINAEKLKQFVFPLPPLAEQKRIVSTIDTVFSILESIDTLQNQYHNNLSVLKEKLIKAAIQGKLTEQLPEDGTAEDLYKQIYQERHISGRIKKSKKSEELASILAEEIPFEIPENWKWIRFGQVITLQSGTDFKPEEYNDKGIGIPYITGASNLSSQGVIINRWTETPKNIANMGDVLLVCKGSGYGKIALCDLEEAHIARQIMAIKKTTLLDMKYILYFLEANLMYIRESGQGLIPGIDRPSILKMLFPLPPLAEQKRIVNKLNELLPLCK